MQTKILIVEDDLELAETISTYLASKKFYVRISDNLSEVSRVIAEESIDIVLLDVSIKKTNDGLLWLEDYRKNNDISHQITIIILSAHVQVNDRIMGISKGADMYLTKPINLDELTAILYRLEEKIAHTQVKKVNAMPKWRLDEPRWVLIAPNGIEIKLTAHEFLLAKFFLETANRIISRSEIVMAIGAVQEENHSDYYDFRRLETLIKRLKDKCFAQSGVNINIKSVRSRGYIFTQ